MEYTHSVTEVKKKTTTVFKGKGVRLGTSAGVMKRKPKALDPEARRSLLASKTLSRVTTATAPLSKKTMAPSLKEVIVIDD
jgi:hypothetical protein